MSQGHKFLVKSRSQADADHSETGALDNVVLSYKDNVLVCTNLTDKEPHTQVCVGRLIASGSLCSPMVRTLALEW